MDPESPERRELVARVLAAIDSQRVQMRRPTDLGFEVRGLGDASETGDGSFTIAGHAAVVGQETVLGEIPGLVRVREIIEPAAFDPVLATNPDVHLNINHDMHYAMARTRVQGIGALELSMDSIGLRDFARVSPDISFVRDLAIQMKTGVIDQQSFSFTIAHEKRSEVDDGEMIDVLYTIQEIGQLYDVCICAQGAYSQTDSHLHARSLAGVLGRAGIDPAGLMLGTHRSLEGADGSHVELVTAGGVSERDKQLAAMRARARIALHTHQR